jgi:hypothetical protein
MISREIRPQLSDTFSELSKLRNSSVLRGCFGFTSLAKGKQYQTLAPLSLVPPTSYVCINIKHQFIIISFVNHSSL